MPHLVEEAKTEVLDMAEDPDHNEVLVEITTILLDATELLGLDEEVRRRYPVDGRLVVGDQNAVFWVYQIEPGWLKRD